MTTPDIADTTTNSAPLDYRPLPGMDILKVVYDEAVRRAQDGAPPAYAFLRIDVYLLAQAANSAQGVMNWLDASTGLNCYLLPLMPGEGQSPFILCNNTHEASQVLISSFPVGTFQEVPATNPDLSTDDGGNTTVTDGCPVDDVLDNG